MRILLAEDSASERVKLSGLLTTWGYDVYEAADGVEAWDLFEQHGFSFVLSDWQMPEIDGIELTKRIREKEDTGIVYIVLLTARSAIADVVTAMEYGADAFLTKPAVPDELRARIQAGERILRLEKKLERRNQQLMDAQTLLFEAEKLEGIAQLAAGMAHEINNPLSIVSGSLDNFALAFGSLFRLAESAEAVLPDLGESQPEIAARLESAIEQCGLAWLVESTPRLLGAAQTGIHRVRDIVTQLRTFAHHDQAQVDRIDAVKAVDTAIQMLNAELESSRVTVELVCGEVPLITCSPARLNQAIYNVLRNAIQASPPESVVDVSVQSGGVQSGSEVILIRVEDRGPGIPAELVSRVFEPFFTSREVGTGRGLGLSFSHRIIQDHRGSIICSARPGGGTVFEISVPVSQDEPESSDSE